MWIKISTEVCYNLVLRMLYLIDLVIGAFESQVVFVLRSRPVAIASISLNITVKKIELNTFACKHNGLFVNW